MSRTAGVPSEPKDGDFAAYVESLQQAQLEALKAANPRPASLNEMHEAIEEKRSSIAGFLEAIAKRSGKTGTNAGGKTGAAGALPVPGLGRSPKAEDDAALSSKFHSSNLVGAGISVLLTFGGAAGALHAFETGNEHLASFCLFALFIGITLLAQLRKTQKRRNRR